MGVFHSELDDVRVRPENVGGTPDGGGSAAPTNSPTSGWLPIETYRRTDEDEPELVIVLQGGRRFLAQWDAAAGHFQGLHAFDGVERDRYFQEWPGRLYGPTHWMPLPAPPQ